MAMTESKKHIVIVTFNIDSDNQRTALQEIGDYVGKFLSQQPGFLGSRLHSGLDGASIVHYAEWECQADFLKAGEKARSHPSFDKLMSYKPNGLGYRLHRSFP
tara:strand:- start:202 stop:510 length:309 start_codon:yes stop_codon:yes gene_type:complete